MADEKAKAGKGKRKVFGEWDQNGIRTRNVETYVKLDQTDEKSRKENPSNFEKITYTEPNFRNTEAASKHFGKNFLAVLNAGAAFQAKKNATSIVSTARKMAALTGGSIQEEMEAIRQRTAAKRKTQ